MSWDEFLSLGNYYVGRVEADRDLTRPLFRAYTSGSTGPSKQVIHCANSILGTVCQMNFYGGIRPDPSDLDGDMPSACTGSSCGFHGNASAVIQ